MKFYIDSPRQWEKLSSWLRLQGWCFKPEQQIIGVRLCAPCGVFEGKYRLARADVAAALVDAPSPSVGFEIRARLPHGRSRIRLQACNPEGRWETFFTTELSTTLQRPFWMGGGSNSEVVAFQMPTHAVHPPRKIVPERFPRPNRASRSPLPDLTIVIPNYYGADYLEECIRSVATPGSDSLHAIVQDGGSNDHSVEIIRRYENQLSRWQSMPDAGQADAIKRGFASTKGSPSDVMAWINSDDCYLPGALQFVQAYFGQNPDVDVVYGHRILIDKDSREIARWFLPPHDPEILRLNDFVPQETMFWRRRVWDEVGGIDTSFQFAMDWDLLLRFQTAGANIVRLPYFLGCFRIHSAQKTSAQMESIGQKEIDLLRQRTFGRMLTPLEIENDPRLISYLRKSAWIEFLWRRFRIRHP